MKKDLESSSKEMDTSYTPRNISGPQKLLTLSKLKDLSCLEYLNLQSK